MVTGVARQHMSAGIIGEVLALLPADLRQFVDGTASEPAGAATPQRMA
jgi:hypothetical protein